MMNIILFLIASLLITLGGVLITISVHLIPVGGAPAAMAQATGVGTGTTQLAAGAGLTGLLVAVSVHLLSGDVLLSIILGGIGSAIMISIVMLISNIGYIYGIGIPLASGKAVRDPMTKDRQDIYVSKGTEGHGIPTAAFLSGIVGGIIGGIGGSLIYSVIYTVLHSQTDFVFSTPAALTISILLSISIYFINAVIASYNIGGTIEGYYDPKFKKLPKAIIVSAVMTFICGIMSLFIVIQQGGAL
ncbi:tetrahydromethanopterin S-methyltransferase subunit D [Methanimicrococcus blatticola]|uniref:Tetrahydromethanopterin S-methyltransferase subunit D n=1 Tax=Methanimicrococcus blatticola TaxID=91560 RepID=A0A484F6M7_9EURY|nr:tetrahydromethanopterin S-methyltransferase subunit D [Methanimicrococcus blatticola]MBZ3936112.1 tetrahydromethanopterin S-methyltransferase subunit D [Methanimicrococcus blatticola]MCC2508355.1 tetrahydromethanopterin S-methyltransferase subunit D [Methanimicrococcus blatticola]TDQ70192.1 tetrahydromethanopterin S-methyltransferase subunit D [Methanimicrococcus blatticola]